VFSLRTVKSLIFGFFAVCDNLKSGIGRPQKVVEDAAKALETEKFN
jgi:hypothetical protein